MKPGRDLDVLIAEKVMGFAVIKTVWGKHKQFCQYSLGPPDYYDDAGESILHNPLPLYSTDIAAAWEVVATLQFSGSAFKYEEEHIPSPVGTDSYTATFLNLNDESPKYILGEAMSLESAPHAICLAALKAVGAP